MSRPLVCTEHGYELVAASSLKESFVLSVVDTTLPRTCNCNGKRMLQVPPPPFIYQPTFAYGNCVHNAISALVGRVGMSVPLVDPNILSRAHPIVSHLAKVIGHLCPISYDDVISAYTGSKKRRYQDALSELIGTRRVPKPGLKMFVKVESNLYNNDKVRPAARPIQYHNYAFALELATFIKPFEHKLYEIGDDKIFGIGRTFFKNLNTRQRGKELRKKWDSFNNPVAYGWDAHRYDAHKQLPVMLEIEHELYNQVFKSERLRRVLNQLQVTKGKFKGNGKTQLKYMVSATQVSGSMNTAAGNCIVMAVLLAVIYTTIGVPWTLADDGDDSVVITEGQVDERLPIEIAARFGFVLKLEGKWTEFEHIKFCQCQPVNVDGSWVMIRDPWRSITKSLSNPKFTEPKALAKKLRTLAQGELSLNTGVPILQAFYLRLRELATKQMSLRSRLKNGGWDMSIISDYRFDLNLRTSWSTAKETHVSAMTRFSFAKAFGVAPNEQLDLEYLIAEWHLPKLTNVVEDSGLEVSSWTWPVYLADFTGHLAPTSLGPIRSG